MKKLTLLSIAILYLNITLCWSTPNSDVKLIKGPNPGPSPIKSSTPNHRNRFLTHFQRSAEEKESAKRIGNIKIVEGLSKTVSSTSSPTTVLKRNPSPHFSKTLKNSVPNSDSDSKNVGSNERVSSPSAAQISKRVGNVRREEDFSNEQELISSGYNSYGPAPPPPQLSYPSPVFTNIPKPIMNYNNYNNYNNNQYNHRPPPAIANYYPTTGGGGGPPPPIVLPPQPYPGPQPVPQPVPQPTPEEPGPSPEPIVFPPEPVGPPMPISPSPPTGTVVPIIGGGGGTETDGEDLLPPAPPDEIFPPSPPEIESVGRSLPLKSSPPNVVRTRITPVGTVPVRTSTATRDPGSVIVGTSPTRLRGGDTQQNSGNRKIVRVKQRDKVKESIESNSDEQGQAQRSAPDDANIITGRKS